MRRRKWVALSISALGCLGIGWAVWHRARTPEPPRGADGYFYDPIEDDPKIRPLIEAADREARAATHSEHGRMGAVHGFWGKKKEILKGKYGIDWRTPAEMNPKVAFD